MKYKVGDVVRIISGDKLNEMEAKGIGVYPMASMIEGLKVEIIEAKDGFYRFNVSSDFMFSEHVIEGLVEEKSKYGTASYSVKPKSNANCLTRERVDELATKIDKELPSGNQSEWELPDGYIFKDENGNVINATKIVLEKKKKEYPKTYEECCKVMNYCCNPVATKTTHKEELIRKFQFLLLYRDTYWKIAGEEMGLGKPWEPDWEDVKSRKYAIVRGEKGKIIKGDTTSYACAFAFPTAEMRDTFKENFDPDIEICKELL